MNTPKKIEKYFTYVGRLVSYVFTMDPTNGKNTQIATYTLSGHGKDHGQLAINEAQRLNDLEREPYYGALNT